MALGRPKKKKIKEPKKPKIPFEYVKEECCVIPSYNFVGLTKNIIKFLSDKTLEYEKKGYINIVFDTYDAKNYALWGERLENDLEYKRRISLHKITKPRKKNVKKSK